MITGLSDVANREAEYKASENHKNIFKHEVSLCCSGRYTQ